MKKINFNICALFFLGSIGFLTSCNKDEEVTPSQTKPTSEQNFAAAKTTLDVIAEIQDLNNLAMSVSMGNQTDPETGGRISAVKEIDCGTVDYQVNQQTGSGTITVDFGNGQQCANGEMRKGKIIFTTTSAAANSVNMSATFIGYEANEKKLDGTYSIVININETDNSFIYTYDFKNAVLTYKDGSKITWKSNYVMTFKFDLGDLDSDNFKMNLTLNGGLSGTDRQGKAFSAQITSPLIIDGTCQYGLTTGKYLLQAEGYSQAVYDFGKGDCDNMATLTIDGKSESITIEN